MQDFCLVFRTKNPKRYVSSYEISIPTSRLQWQQYISLYLRHSVEMEEGGLGSVLSNQKQWLCCVPPLPLSGQVGTLLFRNIDSCCSIVPQKYFRLRVLGCYFWDILQSSWVLSCIFPQLTERGHFQPLEIHFLWVEKGLKSNKLFLFFSFFFF